MLQEHPAVKEQNGICYYKYFRGIPDYGQGIELPDSKDAIYVKDFGVYQKDIIELGPENFTFEVLEECEKTKLDEHEDYWQEFYQAKEFGYSIK